MTQRSQLELDGFKVSFNLVATDSFIEAVTAYPMLRVYYLSLTPTEKHLILGSQGFVARVDTKIIKRKLLYMVLRPNASAPIVAHEAFHLSLRALGMEIKNEELHAHFIQHTTETVIRELKKFKQERVSNLLKNGANGGIKASITTTEEEQRKARIKFEKAN